MAWKPKTLAGKILKGVVIGAAAVGTVAAVAATGGAAAPAGAGLMVKLGVGALTIGKGVVKGAKAVGKAAVNLTTGTSKVEREQIQQVKAEAKAAQDKIQQVERLVKAGASRAKAMILAGVTPEELGSADAAEKQAELDKSLISAKEASLYTSGAEEVKAEEEAAAPTPEPITAGEGCLVTTLLLLAGAVSAGFTILTIF